MPVLPGPDVPLVDPKTGRMTLAWRQFFEALMKTLSA